MDAYYLWDPYDNINIGGMISRGPESRFLVTVKRPGGLEPAMSELAALAASQGKKRRLEVHCHGLPGALNLGGDKTVSNHNARSFGTALGQILLPGGLIELLACEVASQKGDGSVLEAPKHRITGYRDDYHGALRLNRTREYDKAPKLARVSTVGADGTVEFGEPKWTMMRTELPHYGGRFTLREKPMQENPNAFFRPDYGRDGLRFCLDLAASSGCTVRAACRFQTEEGSLSDHRRLAATPVGNWEYEVFDFNPDGRIQFLGSSPYRGPINSFDMVTRTPAA